jgi:hypothetical protein
MLSLSGIAMRVTVGGWRNGAAASYVTTLPATDRSASSPETAG